MAKREVTILSEKEIEYAKQSFLKTKEIKSLRERYLNVDDHNSRLLLFAFTIIV